VVAGRVNRTMFGLRARRKNATTSALAGSPQALLGLVAAGDAAAVRQCIASYGPVVWTIARRFAPASESGLGEASEAVQEIFVDLWKHAGRYDPKLGSEQAFVVVLARRRMLDRLQRAEQRPAIVPVPETLAGDDLVVVERCVEAEIAAGVLAPLDPHQRRALSLAIGQAMTHAQIAELTGMPLAPVKSLIRRALVAVRKRVLAQQGAPIQ